MSESVIQNLKQWTDIKLFGYSRMRDPTHLVPFCFSINPVWLMQLFLEHLLFALVASDQGFHTTLKNSVIESLYFKF